MSNKPSDILVSNDTSWFDEEPEKYLERDDFKEFARAARVDLRELVSDKLEKVNAAQERLAQQSVILNEIRKSHFGYGFPLLVYTHDFALFEKVPDHKGEIDEIILGFDMCDSLRRRHIALSYAVLLSVTVDLYEKMGRPIVVKNLGSGVGLDSLHLLQETGGKVSSILNYDTDGEAIGLGQQVTDYLETEKSIERGVMQYVQDSLTKSLEPADMIVKVGVICGLRDSMAQMLLAADHHTLNPGGRLVVTSSNEHMRQTDPLASFLIQHIGTSDDPQRGWGLNFRSKESISRLLKEVGFIDVQIYDDSNYPGKEDLPDEVLRGIDTLPARAMDRKHMTRPLRLPPEDVLDNHTGYNWIAVATKSAAQMKGLCITPRGRR